MMALVTDCFNVLGPDGKAYMYVGSGSSAMAEQAATNTAGVVWVQEAAKTAFGAGGSLVAIALTCFAYSTCIAYYYEGESGLAYLMKDTHPHLRKTGIWIIRILMPIFFFVWANVTATTAWAISEVMFGLMAGSISSPCSYSCLLSRKPMMTILRSVMPVWKCLISIRKNWGLRTVTFGWISIKIVLTRTQKKNV